MQKKVSLEPWSERNIPEIAALWNRNFPEAFHVTEFWLMKKTVQDGDLFVPGTLALRGEDGIIAAVATKISDGILPEYYRTAWLSSLVTDVDCRRRGFGGFLYRRAEAELKKSGVRTVISGGEMHNFFSGIPEPEPETERFFQSLGFVLNDVRHYDLSSDVSRIDFDRVGVPMNETSDFVTSPATELDFPEMRRFFDREFPGRWKFEVMRHLESGGDPGEILLLRRGREVCGFCKVHVNHDGRNGEFNSQLGKSWGALGPIGISEAARGKGLGARLLRDALKHLQRGGAHNVNIDWTVLKDFYGQFGFQPWRTYLAAYKEL
ncbi:Acetyltransferase (GNAT) family protein [Caprobacter fermentans]|uniref:Acetyltransferase (GNAT) family protein n=1 Tax=Caproicibacter fermentans TaxID=2576756 RepID=A0A6N8HW66_9FIRM|nr:Acetyltransferase (GNAT) family protein [Caproicibacter fermentans]